MNSHQHKEPLIKASTGEFDAYIGELYLYIHQGYSIKEITNDANIRGVLYTFVHKYPNLFPTSLDEKVFCMDFATKENGYKVFKGTGDVDPNAVENAKLINSWIRETNKDQDKKSLHDTTPYRTALYGSLPVFNYEIETQIQERKDLVASAIKELNELHAKNNASIRSSIFNAKETLDEETDKDEIELLNAIKTRKLRELFKIKNNVVLPENLEKNKKEIIIEKTTAIYESTQTKYLEVVKETEREIAHILHQVNTKKIKAKNSKAEAKKSKDKEEALLNKYIKRLSELHAQYYDLIFDGVNNARNKILEIYANDIGEFDLKFKKLAIEYGDALKQVQQKYIQSLRTLYPPSKENLKIQLTHAENDYKDLYATLDKKTSAIIEAIHEAKKPEPVVKPDPAPVKPQPKKKEEEVTKDVHEEDVEKTKIEDKKEDTSSVNYEELSLLQKLNYQIELTKKNDAAFHSIEAKNAFATELETLYAHVKKLHVPSEEFAKTKQGKVANETVKLLQEVNAYPTPRTKTLNQALIDYNDNCYRATNRFGTLGKIVATTLITALCTLVGFGLGLGIDFLFGFASLGAFSIAGAKFGFGAATILITSFSTVSSLTSSWFGFFKKSKLDNEYAAVHNEGKLKLKL